MLKLYFWLFISIFLYGCASYQWGFHNYSLPEGYRKVSVPLMQNKTYETGAEVYFTQALRRALNHISQSVKVTSHGSVILKGVIEDIKVFPTVQAKGATEELFRLPQNATLNTRYKVVVKVNLKLIKSNDKSVIWEKNFQGEELYSAPRLESPVINSANALYNLNARHRTLKILAKIIAQDVQSKLFGDF